MRWGTYDADRVRLDPAPAALLVLLLLAVVTLGFAIGDPGAPADRVAVVGDEFVTDPTVDALPPALTVEPSPWAAGPVGSVTQTATRGTAAPVGTIPPVSTGAPLWAGPLPAYGNRPACTRAAATVITGAFAAVGASYASQVWALLVASRESGCDTSAHNRNDRTRDDSYGWCQANARAGHFGPAGILAGFDRDRMLIDLDHASQACAELWRVCGRGPWQPPYSCATPPELR